MKQQNLFTKLNDIVLSLQNISIKEKLLFYRLLSTMTNAGMTLLQSMSTLENQEKNIAFKKILADFISGLEGGKTLSECMSLYPKSFGESEIGIVKSGEKTGKLNTVLLDLAEQLEKMESISGKLKAAMIYPAFILLVVISVVSVMMIFIVPKLISIFEGQAELPLSTKILIATSNFLILYWYIIIIFIIICVIFMKLWKNTLGGRYLYDRFLFQIPIFGNMNQKLILSRFSRLFSGLVRSGVSIVGSLQIVSEGIGSEVYRQRILLLQEDIKKGIKIWETLGGDPLFPPMMIQMIKVGEQTARLDQTLLKVADFYDEEVNNIITTLHKLLEPIIIVFLAVVVGGISLAIMQPVMQLAETVSG